MKQVTGSRLRETFSTDCWLQHEKSQMKLSPKTELPATSCKLLEFLPTAASDIRIFLFAKIQT
jgi:hypothetical protein